MKRGDRRPRNDLGAWDMAHGLAVFVTLDEPLLSILSFPPNLVTKVVTQRDHRQFLILIQMGLSCLVGSRRGYQPRC